MTKSDSPTPPTIHNDVDLFRAALAFTAAERGFLPHLIERDYFCSVILSLLSHAGDDLVFRGGTSLSKVHAGFYRLSEDLDFVISTSLDATRGERRRRVQQLKRQVARLDDEQNGVKIIRQLTGANTSRQYDAVVGYKSVLDSEIERIRIEIGLREPILVTPDPGSARTLLLNPLTGKPAIPEIAILVLTREETYAEKFRAALSRREAAIRDFYDIDHAVRNMGLQTESDTFLRLIKRKLSMPGNAPVDVSPDRLSSLRRQMKTELRPVLREEDFEAFDLERAFLTVSTVAELLTQQEPQ